MLITDTSKIMIKIRNHHVLSIKKLIICMNGARLRNYFEVLNGFKKHLNLIKISQKTIMKIVI